MEQNAFSEGVALGGLRDQSEIKLLICYLIKALGRPLSRGQINEILQEYPVANYFEVNQAMSELVKNGTVVSELQNDEEVLSLTPRMALDVETIERSLPRTIREKAVAAALQVLTRERIKRESRVEVTALSPGYHVTFTIIDADTELMKLTVYVADARQIEVVKRNFYDHAVDLYSDVISVLTVE
ncbi:MAG: DUF4364 family protein [Clostridia bacterium]|nr:DUF4364 family protein [Clostridia bacterium]MBR3552041.1 DUF4364 family protein [Clostridia bacterium]